MLYLFEPNTVTPFGSKINVEEALNELTTKNKKEITIKDEHDFIVNYLILSDQKVYKHRNEGSKSFKNFDEVEKYIKEKYPRCHYEIDNT